MGQPSIFLLNRQGTFQFWNELWDSKIFFLKYFKENIFLKKVLSIFLNNKNFIHWKLFNYIDFSNLNKNVKEIIFNQEITLHNFFFVKNRLKLSFIYTSKCWLFKYQGWTILNIFTLNTRRRALILKKNKKNLKNFFYFFTKFIHRTQGNKPICADFI